MYAVKPQYIKKRLPTSVKNVVLIFSYGHRYHFSENMVIFISYGDILLKPFNYCMY